MTTEYLRRLNPEQYQAATQVEGPLLILAGAGSGKTGVLTCRIAHMLELGIPAENILAVTFTNKAAREMKERVVKLAGESAEKVWISTFHSSCARILRMDVEPLGWTSKFTIYDDDDQLRMIKEIVANLGYDPERVPPREILGQIDHHKNRLAGSPDELLSQRRSHVNDPLVRIWREYDERLKAADAVDFNDLIRLTLLLFGRHPDVRSKWADRFRYILVDEYQDTNRTQYQLLRSLTSERRNLAVVGDDDQSIYGFRGADITNILGFREDFPEAKIIRLEQNYRCTKNILSVANTVVALNTGRMEKKLWTKGAVGHLVRVKSCQTPREEAEWVARAIRELRKTVVDEIPRGARSRCYEYGEMAVIYRTNATSRVFESALRDQSIPYRIVGGRKFYEHREIRDVLAYLRVVVNPADDAALLRIINVPSRSIGPKTLATLREEAATRGEPLLRAAQGKAGNQNAAARALGAFVELILELTEAARELDPARLVLRVIDRTGYRAMLEAEDSLEARTRLENLDELVRAADSFDVPAEATTPMELLRAWLDRVTLAGQDDEIPEGGEVTLMTVHNSKGLEYPVVFVVHMMEGQFPHQRSLETDKDVEEERRLAYVAFTRAKQRLLITRSQMVQPLPRADIPGPQTPRPAAPSRFLFGLPADSCKGDLPTGEPSETEASGPTSLSDEQKAKLRTFVQRQVAPKVEAPPESFTLIEIESLEQLETGVKVHHPRFGIGVVRARSAFSVVVSFGAGRPMTVRADGLQLVRD